jgi:hypothetical protein
MMLTWLDILQWVIASTGTAAFVLSVGAWSLALNERRALRRVGKNGRLLIAVRHHFVTAACRTIMAALSTGGGFVLIQIGEYLRPAGVLSGVIWLMFNIAMVIELSMHLWVSARLGQLFEEEFRKE